MRKVFFIALCITANAAYSQPGAQVPVAKCDLGFFVNKISIDSIFGLQELCTSVNETEIRLETVTMPNLKYHLIILAYKKNIWTAQKFECNMPAIANPSKGQKVSLKQSALFPCLPFDSVYSILKANNVFTLGNQADIKYESLTADGGNYAVAFKNADKYGKYTFSTPEFYQQVYKEIQEFRNYAAILDILSNCLHEK